MTWKIGFNLLYWTTQVTAEHEPVLAELARLGYDGVEIPLGAGEVADYAALGAKLDALGLARTAVTSLDAATNPVSPDPSVRAAAATRLSWAIDCAEALGAEVLCGPYHSAYKLFTGSPPTDEELAHSAAVLGQVAPRAAAAGLRMALEPLNRFECYLVNTASEGRALAERSGHEAVGVLYDTHHMHIEEKDVGAAVRAAGPRLAHVHVAENDRGTCGSGQVAWAETFRALREVEYDGWLVVEAFTRLDPEFAGAIHVWREYDPLDDVPRGSLAFLREQAGLVTQA